MSEMLEQINEDAERLQKLVGRDITLNIFDTKTLQYYADAIMVKGMKKMEDIIDYAETGNPKEDAFVQRNQIAAFGKVVDTQRYLEDRASNQDRKQKSFVIETHYQVVGATQ